MNQLLADKPTNTRVTAPKPQGHLGDELVWTAAETHHDIQTIIKRVHLLSVLSINTITGVIIMALTMAITLGPHFNGTASVVAEIVAYNAAVATGITAAIAAKKSLDTKQLLDQTLATKQVEVKGELVNIKPLLVHQKQGPNDQ